MSLVDTHITTTEYIGRNCIVRPYSPFANQSLTLLFYNKGDPVVHPIVILSPLSNKPVRFSRFLLSLLSSFSATCHFSELSMHILEVLFLTDVFILLVVTFSNKLYSHYLYFLSCFIWLVSSICFFIPSELYLLSILSEVEKNFPLHST